MPPTLLALLIDNPVAERPALAGHLLTGTSFEAKPWLGPPWCQILGLDMHRPAAQVYNEAIYDLLTDNAAVLGARPALQLKDNATGHVTVPGLTKARTRLCRVLDTLSLTTVFRGHGKCAKPLLEPSTGC